VPELPEVESVRKGLNSTIKGQKIEQVDIFWDRIIAEPEDTEQFKERLKGQEFEEVKRRGKFLLFYLTKDVMISHLRMEGKYYLYEAGEPVTKHTHVIFHLSNGKELRYLDVRKFGRISLAVKGEEFNNSSLVKLGPEPIKEEFTLGLVHPFLSRRTKAIKSILLDQQLVVGVGNIYADEILYESYIHPEKPGNQLTETEEKKLHHAVISILEKAIQAGGTTIRSYTNTFGENGNYQNQLKVYGKEGTPCQRCGTLIEKIKVNGRGTHFCPYCQKNGS